MNTPVVDEQRVAAAINPCPASLVMYVERGSARAYCSREAGHKGAHERRALSITNVWYTITWPSE